MKTINKPEIRSSASDRAYRLRRLRSLAHLSRKALCCDSDINLNTLIGWEVARHGGLSAVGARKVLKRIWQEGVVCSEQWLLTGTGTDPYIIPNAAQAAQLQFPSENSQMQQILAEMDLFKQHCPNAISVVVPDQSMKPFFELGDFVCGCMLPLEEAKHYVGRPCIVLTNDGKQLLRNILLGKKENTICLFAGDLLANTSSDPLVMEEIMPLYIAPIIWHRRLIKSHGKHLNDK